MTRCVPLGDICPYRVVPAFLQRALHACCPAQAVVLLCARTGVRMHCFVLNMRAHLLCQSFGFRLAASDIHLAIMSPGTKSVTVCTSSGRPSPPSMSGWQSPTCGTVTLTAMPTSVSLSFLEQAAMRDVVLAVGVDGGSVLVYRWGCVPVCVCLCVSVPVWVTDDWR